jgi:hypothetical protein
MLSLSAEISESDVNLQMINGEAATSGGVIEHGVALMEFAQACVARHDATLASARDRLLAEAGAEVLVDAAAVAGNFQRMVRIADSTGIPLDARGIEAYAEVIDSLDLGRFPSAHNTPGR